MVFPMMAAAVTLAGFAPIIAKWLGGEQAQQVATKVVDIAQKVTGTSEPFEAIQLLQQDKNMVSEFQKASPKAKPKSSLHCSKTGKMRVCGMWRI